MVTGCLYSLTSPSGKEYIGITMRPLKERWRVHKASANTRCEDGVLQKAIRKYGADSFIVKTLVIADDFEYLKDLERRAIIGFGTKVPNGYNMTDGGDGVLGVVITEANKANRSAGQKIRFSDPEKKARHLESQRTPEIRQFRATKKPSEETRKKISAAHKLLWATSEHREKMAEKPRGPKPIDDGLTNWQRYRLRDLAGYRKRKREYAARKRAEARITTDHIGINQ